MPVKIPNNLPATHILEKENIFIMPSDIASHQDIRPLKILLVNLMPTKIATETQFVRLLSNSPLQIDLELLGMSTHKSKNTSQSHLTEFYKTFETIKGNKYDGMIVTGAPVEQLNFEDVDYWDELCEIFDWAKRNVYSTMFICWGAQAALYHYYGIKKNLLSKKFFGIYSYTISDRFNPLLRGFNDYFNVPQSRHTSVSLQAIKNSKKLEVLASSKENGFCIASSQDCRQIFITGHLEYDTATLSKEYFRDIEKGLDIDIPVNYFKDNNPNERPVNTWRANANLLFSNWLNYFVYQNTPYNLENL